MNQNNSGHKMVVRTDAIWNSNLLLITKMV